MFENENIPTEVVMYKPRIDVERYLDLMVKLAQILTMISDASDKMIYAKQQYNTHSDASSPFVSKSQWADEARKWNYITYRLERYYFKKLYALNCEAYKSMTE